MGVPQLLRLIIALLVLGCAMASPASAAAAMATRAMPCHEPVVQDAAAAADLGHSAHATPAVVGQGGTLLHPPAPDAVRLHMCCVLSQLIAPPLAVMGVTAPAPRAIALSPPDTAPLPGLAWPAPVPPPRIV